MAQIGTGIISADKAGALFVNRIMIIFKFTIPDNDFSLMRQATAIAGNMGRETAVKKVDSILNHL